MDRVTTDRGAPDAGSREWTFPAEPGMPMALPQRLSRSRSLDARVPGGVAKARTMVLSGDMVIRSDSEVTQLEGHRHGEGLRYSEG